MKDKDNQVMIPEVVLPSNMRDTVNQMANEVLNRTISKVRVLFFVITLTGIQKLCEKIGGEGYKDPKVEELLKNIRKMYNV